MGAFLMGTQVENTKIETSENTSENNNKIVESQPVETQEQINWKKFREQREIERKQKEAAEKRAAEKSAEADALKAAMEAILDKKPTNSVDNGSRLVDEEETDDQKIDKRVNAALEARDRQYQLQRIQQEQQELPQKLSQAYSDFNQVCSTENLDYLEYHYPEIARAFRNAPDGFDKWSDVYKTVKRFVPNTDSKKDQQKAEKNFNKPQSMTVSGVTQVGDTAPIQLDDKKRSDNWKRMQAVIKGRG